MSVPRPTRLAPSAAMPPQIPERTSSKDRIQKLKRDKEILKNDYIKARKGIRPSHSFDVLYWNSASTASAFGVRFHEAEMRLALARFQDKSSGVAPISFWSTSKAHVILDKLRAATLEKKLYQEQAIKVEKGGAVRRAIVAMFNTSQVGLEIEKSGAGRRSRTRFKDNLAKDYNAEIRYASNRSREYVYDTATGRLLQDGNWRAAHIVPHSLGPDLLVALFGSNVEGELESSYNGLVLDPRVEKAMDDGAIVIVPNLPNDPSPAQVSLWEVQEPKDYKWRVLDPEAACVHVGLSTNMGPDDPLRDVIHLDGRRLFFRNNFRPRARYLYFLFVIAQLKQAWRSKYRKEPGKVLKSQLGKGMWASKGRYLRRAFLLALAEEIGHDTDIADNIPPAAGDDNEPDEAGLLGIAKMVQEPRKLDDEWDEWDEWDEGYDGESDTDVDEE